MDKRIDVLHAYKDNMVLWTQPMLDTPISKAELESHIKAIVQERFTDPTVEYIHTLSPGNVVLKQASLLKFLRSCQDKIIAPSGSIYQTADKQISFTSQFIDDNKAIRNKYKKMMFEAIAARDTMNAQRYECVQATAKVGNNSVPGSFGQARNNLYDKGGYNAVTSTARVGISESYLIFEQMLGGNFAFFNETDIINYIVTNIPICPPNIEEILIRNKIRLVSHKELMQFYLYTIGHYQHNATLSLVEQYISKLSIGQISYLFYLGNLRHLIWTNGDTFRPVINDILHPSESTDSVEDIKVDELFSFDGDMIVLLSVLKANEIEALKADKDEKLGIYDLPKRHPEVAKRFIRYARTLQAHLDRIDELFKIFVNVRPKQTQASARSGMWRNTSILSDTDSVIYTCKDWVQWNTGNIRITEEGFFTTSLMIFWISKAISSVLVDVSISFGATGKYIKMLSMKNEYLYPVMIMYDKKKTYAGIMAVQEGIVLSPPKIDIKGANLRGSDICAECTAFNRKFIDTIMNELYTKGKVSAKKYIAVVVEHELVLRNDLLAGNARYCKSESIKQQHEYKDAEERSNSFDYADFWNTVFGPDYDIINLPSKVSLMHIIQPSPVYLANLSKSNPVVYKRMVEFQTKYGGTFPGGIGIGTANGKIPKELMPLMDLRAIVYHNCRPLYLTLDELCIYVGTEANGNKNKRVLMSDLYY